MNQTIDCYFRCYGKQVTMATEECFYISLSESAEGTDLVQR